MKKSKKVKRAKGKRITRSQFYEMLAARLEDREFTKRDIQAVFDELYELVMDKLPQVGKIPIGSLGNMILRERKARWGYNPFKKEKIWVEAKKVCKFQVNSKIRKTFAPPKKKAKVSKKLKGKKLKKAA